MKTINTVLLVVAVPLFIFFLIGMRRVSQNKTIATVAWLLIVSIVLAFIFYRNNAIQ